MLHPCSRIRKKLAWHSLWKLNPCTVDQVIVSTQFDLGWVLYVLSRIFMIVARHDAWRQSKSSKQLPVQPWRSTQTRRLVFLQLYICYRCILENVRGPEGSDLKRNLIQRMSEMTFDPGRCAIPGYFAPSFGLWRVLRSEDVMYAPVQWFAVVFGTAAVSWRFNSTCAAEDQVH